MEDRCSKDGIRSGFQRFSHFGHSGFGCRECFCGLVGPVLCRGKSLTSLGSIRFCRGGGFSGRIQLVADDFLDLFAGRLELLLELVFDLLDSVFDKL